MAGFAGMTALDPGLPLTQAALWQWSSQAPVALSGGLEPGADPAHTAEQLTLSGAVDEAAFFQALEQLWTDLPQLRARVALGADGQVRHWLGTQPVQQPERWEGRSPAALKAWHRRPYELETGELTRQAYWTDGGGGQLNYLLGVHHLALDGYGYALLWQRLAAEYRALTLGQPRPAAWADIRPVLEEEAAYLASGASAQDARALEALYTYRPAEPAPLLERGLAWGHRASVQLGLDTRRELETLAQQAGVNWAEWLLALLAHDWWLETGEAEPLTGLAMMNRMGTPAAGVPLMRMNMLPLPTPAPAILDPADLGHAARQIRATLQELRPHARFRYEELWQRLGQRRLFGLEVNIIPFTLPLDFGPEVQASVQSLISGPTEDLAWTLSAAPGQTLNVVLEGHPALYSPEDVQARLSRLEQWLSSRRT
ncbi:condensation domain-containing protein [Deinococcus radiophilus]|uniref:condensation domain-containing protein n=1 Tax=Deinococcus radiophilus TaxID=32062 RepID=UPI001E62293C|nr:condensation domain-containing protein [Deinococcus radiophilus]UFA51850.1 condensation domain-containing protein [Deinococcus radiophilus]